MNSEKKKIFVILGMHRSGTSATSRAMKVFDINLGDNLMPPVSGINDKGFWEDEDIYKLNEEMLSKVESDWCHVREVSDSDFLHLRDKGYFVKAVELIRTKLCNADTFAFKDPRMGKMLPFWIDVFEHCQFDVRYVITLRHPLSVVKSLSKRDKFVNEHSYFLWLTHVLLILIYTKNTHRVLVDYDNLISNPDHEINRIAKALNLTVNPDELNDYRVNFLDQHLRHTSFSLQDLVIDKTCPSIVLDVYQTLNAIANDTKSLTSIEDNIRDWQQILKNYQSAFNLIDQSFLKLRTFESSITNSQAVVAAQHETIVQKDTQINGLSGLVSEKDAQISNLNRFVTEKDAQISDLISVKDAQINGLNSVISEKEAQIKEFAEFISNRKSEISDLKNHLLIKEAELEHANATISHANATILIKDNELQHHVESYNLQLENRNQHIVNLQNAIENIQSSFSWKVTKPIRFFTSRLKTCKRYLSKFFFSKKEPVVSDACFTTNVSNVESSNNNESFTEIVDLSDESLEIGQKLTKVIPFYISNILEYDLDGFSNGPIALHIYLDKEQDVENLTPYLKNIPLNFDLYLSLKYEGDKLSIKGLLKDALVLVGDIHIQVIPAYVDDYSALTFFGEKLIGYTYIAHIACNQLLEKSLHLMMSNLFGHPNGDSSRVFNIFSLLSKKAKIVTSEFSEGLYEVNDVDIQDTSRLINKLDQNEGSATINILDDSFFYGGVFWASVESLQNLLTLPIRIDDLSSNIAINRLALTNLIIKSSQTVHGDIYQIYQQDSIKDYAYFEPELDFSKSIKKSNIKVLSYYLPQFHPIPENDLWHGKGFTEWTKVSAANPLFEGHYQQHIPHANIGYYLLDSTDTFKKQVKMMESAGVYGQIFYHYWFTGKLILEKPAQLLLNSPEVNMPFCFCWANENWTKKWDGNEKEVLLQQDYSVEDARAFIHYLIPFFKDSRYIKIDNRPVLYVYRPASIVNVEEYLTAWNEECEQQGVLQPYVVAVLTRGANSPIDFGMDAGVERVLHDWTEGVVPDIKDSLSNYHSLNGSILSYDEVADFYMNQSDVKEFTYFRSIVPMWDNTARYGSDAYLLHSSTPEKYQSWLENIIDYSEKNLPIDRQFVVVNAWNEWAEGAHLEPDTRYGYSYLNATGRALSNIKYKSLLNAEIGLNMDSALHISFAEAIIEQLNNDNLATQRFIHCFKISSIVNSCRLSTNCLVVANALSITYLNDIDNECFVLEVNRVSLFNSNVIERMFKTCISTDTVVIPNLYGCELLITDVQSNGSTKVNNVLRSPLVIKPKSFLKNGFKSVKVRTDAICFLTDLGDKNSDIVTTIIRFHRSGNFVELNNALFSLYAMNHCIVKPLIATQDLDEDQFNTLFKMLNDFIWSNDAEPSVLKYSSSTGNSDIRSKLLNDSLKSVDTHYATFLDYDDYLLPDSFAWMINRLTVTGKAVTFGRVYYTSYQSKESIFLGRNKAFEYGSSYKDLVTHNFAPLHSFMFDMNKLDLSNVVYFEFHKFMEDYYLLLQVINQENSDWESLLDNHYIGDYIKSVDRSHTLAIDDEEERQNLLLNPEYILCEERIHQIKKNLLIPN